MKFKSKAQLMKMSDQDLYEESKIHWDYVQKVDSLIRFNKEFKK